MYRDMAVGGSVFELGWCVETSETVHGCALRRATRVIVLGEDMRAGITAKGVEPARALIVRDGTEILPPNAPLPALDPEVVRAIRGNFSFVLVHAGNLGFYGAWNTLVTAARLLASEGV